MRCRAGLWQGMTANVADYDNRTALMLAAGGGHEVRCARALATLGRGPLHCELLDWRPLGRGQGGSCALGGSVSRVYAARE